MYWVPYDVCEWVNRGFQQVSTPRVSDVTVHYRLLGKYVRIRIFEIGGFEAIDV